MAVAALCGVPARRIIDGDDVERSLWLRVTARAAELRVQMMRAEASHIAQGVGKVLGG